MDIFPHHYFVLFIFYFLLHQIFVAVYRLSLVVASREYSSLRSPGFLIEVASLIVKHRLSATGFSSYGAQT